MDAARFRERFGVRLVEGYGSSEGGAAIQRTPGTPPGAIGRAAPADDLAVVDPDSGEERAPARFGPGGRLLNGDEAIGELVNRGPTPFEGYWRNPEADAERARGGWYWTGDLFYRDADGFLYFMRPHRRPAPRGQREPGRRDDRAHPGPLGAGGRHRCLRGPGPGHRRPGDGRPGPPGGRGLRPGGLRRVPAGPAGPRDEDGPRFVRILDRMPVTATNKIHRVALRRAGFRCPGPVWWDRHGDGSYAPLDAEGLAALLARYEEHGRAV